LLSLSLSPAPGASEEAALPKASAEASVGEAGRLGIIQFEGNEAFDREQLLSALRFDFEVQAAAHPLAPLTAYIAMLEKKILAGYHREGFPEATVHSVLATNASSIRIRVVEGPRFSCGQLRVKGSGTNAAALRTLQTALVNPGMEELDSIFWERDSAAPFDPQALDVLRGRFKAALKDAGYFEPRFKLNLVPLTNPRLADLELDLQSPGNAAVLKKVEINDLFRNTRQQVLDFLKLKPGMPIQPNIADQVFGKLQRSGRFFQHTVQLSPLAEAGHFKLALKLDEFELAPPLDQPLSSAEEALLKFGERVRRWDAQPEDWVCVLDLSLPHSVVRGELVLSSAGLAGVLRTGVSNAPANVKAAGLVAGRRVALYSPAAHRKMVFEQAGGNVPVEVKIPVPRIPFGGPVQEINFGLRPALIATSPKLLDLQLDIPPVNCLCAAHYLESSIKHNELTLTQRDDAGAPKFRLRLDVATGRLLSADYQLPRGSVHLATEAGAFARLINEITAAGSACTNSFESSKGLLSLLPEVAPVSGSSSVALEPEVLHDLDALMGGSEPKSTWSEFRLLLASAGQQLAKIRVLLEADPSGNLLGRWKTFWSAVSKSGGEGAFHIPRELLPTLSPTQQSFAPFAAALLEEADQLVARDSWAWTSLRETISVLEGASEHTRQSIQRLRDSEEMGPVGYAALAALLSRVDVPEGRLFARKGLTRLTPADFQRDYQTLLRTNTVAGDLLCNALSRFQALTPEQIAILAPDRASDQGMFVRDLAQALRSAPGPLADSAWPVFERHWDKVIRRSLEGALNASLPKVQALTNSRALAERGKELFEGGHPTEQAREEMLACFTKAAEQGDAEAQFYLGSYYEHMKDTEKALHWLEQAARQDYPHTGCRLGDIYSQGEKVPPDLDRAAEWYRREAEHGCSWAQYCFGRILMDRKRTAEGLSWYRRAAEGGSGPAMSALGEFYSDDLFNTPDYVEAYVWLRFVTSAANMPRSITLPAATTLRRVRRKLSPVQIVEACKRGAEVSRLIEANQKKAKARPNRK
jgi:tetratricopeptide (TPR) repeat protein